MVHFFLSRAGELNVHFSRCSRLSRFWRQNSRSPLEIRDFEENFSFSSRLNEILQTDSLLKSQNFPLCGGDKFSFLGQKKNKTEIGMWMVVGEFLFLVTKSLKSRRLDLLSNHEICFQNFSFSSRNWRKLQISRLFFAKILVLFSNQKTDLDISLFSSRNSRYGFHISLSLLDFTFWHLVNAC